jgi:hypothetical protein
MNAKEAARNVEFQKTESAKKEATEKLMHDKRASEFKLKGQKDAPGVLKSINNEIQKESLAGRHQVRYYMSYESEEFGYDYLNAVKDYVVKKLTKAGFNILYAQVEDHYGAIYEGLMNPECVGHEYGRHTFIVEVKW